MRFTVSNTVPYPVPIAAVYYEGKLSENFPCQFELGDETFPLSVSGSLSISLKDRTQGKWYNFETGEGGDMLGRT